MRTWVKRSLVAVSLVVLMLLALAGTTAFYVFRHLNVVAATEAAASKDFEAIRSRFGERPHLIQVLDAGKRDFKINRSDQPDGRPVNALHVLTWSREDGEVFRTEVPIWLMRFSTVNLMSHLGLTPLRFRLTVQDLEQYGPGIVVDYYRPGESRVLLWMD